LSACGKKRVLAPPFRSLRDLRIASLVGTGGASRRNAGFLAISLQFFIILFLFPLCLCVSLFVCNQSSVFSPKERNTTAAFRSAKEETKEQIFKAGCSRHGMAAGRVLYNIGFWIRETGQALDRAGCRLQGNNIFKEPCMSSETLITGFFFFLSLLFRSRPVLFSSSLHSQSLISA
jgi:hypothetical protein